ncbi:hypothetical protein OUZ56_005199 [Daphnia magna]|uniref:Uncharacterized protein n=1 Tax=Daphnia magna TaxID=35525 RepID=A0ABQ9YS51_9CRUS|nr:hypothetical protein OUZ56_005199 [Daphnia magna]
MMNNNEKISKDFTYHVDSLLRRCPTEEEEKRRSEREMRAKESRRQSINLLNDSISPSTRNPFACHYTQIDRTRPSINLNKPVSFVIDRVAKRGVGFYPRSITVT